MPASFCWLWFAWELYRNGTQNEATLEAILEELRSLSGGSLERKTKVRLCIASRCLQSLHQNRYPDAAGQLNAT
jgi:hypothetical protein